MSTPSDDDNVVPFPDQPSPVTAPPVVERVVLDGVADSADHQHGGVPDALPESPADAEPLGIVLDAISAHIARFVANPDDAALVTEVLCVAHTHAIDSASSTPRLAAMSPEPASGKTRLMEVLATLVARPLVAASISPSALVYLIDAEDPTPTILLDEVDTIFGRGGGGRYEDLRRVLNAGHRRGSLVTLREPSGGVVSRRTFAPVFLAGLGELPATLRDRAIVIRMQPPLPGQEVEPFDPELHEAEGHALRDRLSRAVAAATINRSPELPPELVGRDADKWRPLIAIADAAGGDWPEAARVAAVAFVAASKTHSPSRGAQLLREIKIIFDRADATALRSGALVANLTERSDLFRSKGRAGQIELAEALRPYGIRSRDVRSTEGVHKSYRRADFEDTWARYLPRVADDLPEPADAP